MSRRAFGVFDGEVDCLCGFMVDRYEDLYGRYEYEDPDTSEQIETCPDCGRSLDALSQRRPDPSSSGESSQSERDVSKQEFP